MRGIILSLASASSLGAVLLGGRALVADRAGEARHAEETAAATPASSGRLWYGGTLAPIVVVGSAPDHTVAGEAHTCPTTGS